jgi:hypothetical protein
LAQALPSGRAARHRSHDRGDQAFRRKSLGHPAQSVEQPLEVVELLAGLRIGRQLAVELGGLGRRGFAVEHRMHQSVEFGDVHVVIAGL